MERRLSDIVIEGFPSKVKPEAFSTKLPRTSAEAVQMLENLRPTAGNLAPSESWRRLIGGRNRYNHERQQIAEARREAILFWLMDNRMFYWCGLVGEHIPVDRIIVRHGDGAMLARALNVGKATICRDLSAVQSVHPWMFGSNICKISYSDYMHVWRSKRYSTLGNEQPPHDLRFPANQRGPKARTRRNARTYRRLGARQLDMRPMSCDGGDQTEERESKNPIPSSDDFLTILETNCSQDELRNPPVRRKRRVSTSGAA